MSHDIVVLVTRKSRRPVSGEELQENFYLLKCPSVQYNKRFNMLLCQVRPANTVAWATSLEGLAARMPANACIVFEADYVKNFWQYAA